MLKVLIVDDEPIIREGLKTIINWEQYGFYICGEAANGREGLMKTRELKPDLAIVDIKMPGISGLQMIEELQKTGTECKFIILTGYSDFEFAQKAIKFGVEAYILKPIDRKELVNELVNMHGEITESKKREQFINESIVISRETFLSSMIMGQVSDDLVKKGNELYGLKLPWKSYQILLVGFETGGDESAESKSGIRKVIEAYINSSNYGYALNVDGYIAMLLKNISFNSNTRPLDKLISDVGSKTGVNIVIALGKYVENLAELRLSYEHAKLLLKRKFIHGYKKIISGETDDCTSSGNAGDSGGNLDIEYIVDSLYMAIDFNSMERINDLLEKVKQHFIKNNFTEDIIKMNYSNIYTAISNRITASGGNLKSFNVSGHSGFEEICKKTSLQELHGYLKYKLTTFSDELSKSKPDSIIKKILDYVDRNYSRDITLGALSEVFNYNSAYLGKLFYKSTGEHFNSYLDRVRIEKVKQLLKEGMKVYQAAEKVGYKNIDYFRSKFKKYTGEFPSAYKSERENET